MGLIVQKFGGTSMAEIKQVAAKIIETKNGGSQLVVVVSAKAGRTDALIEQGRKYSPCPDPRELDMLISVGELESAVDLSIMLNSLGIKATALNGHQAGIETDSNHGQAIIKKVRTGRLKHLLGQGIIPIVAGYQGYDGKGNVTTLGRGGSDTTAIALAAALSAECCEIYTDVEGVFTTDPLICSQARKIEKVTYEELLELASCGAKVMHDGAIALAMKEEVPLHIRSTFSDAAGTQVIGDDLMEKPVFTGIAYKKNQAFISLTRTPNIPGMAAELFSMLGGSGINVDMIVQSRSYNRHFADMSFTVNQDNHARALEIAMAFSRNARKSMQAGIYGDISDTCQISSDKGLAIVSLVGSGMKRHSNVASSMFKALKNMGINIELISTSESRISCMINEENLRSAIRAVHEAFMPGYPLRNYEE